MARSLDDTERERAQLLRIEKPIQASGWISYRRWRADMKKLEPI